MIATDAPGSGVWKRWSASSESDSPNESAPARAQRPAASAGRTRAAARHIMAAMATTYAATGSAKAPSRGRRNAYIDAA